MEPVQVFQRFNRKERDWLIRDAIGPASQKLSNEFISRIEGAIKIKNPNFSMKKDAWWAIDFHIDWIASAMYMLDGKISDQDTPQVNENMLIKGGVQDVDLIVISGNDIVLIEAKGIGDFVRGDGFRHKIRRLKDLTPAVVSSDGKSSNCQLYFVLCSPIAESTPYVDEWPDWAKHCGRPLSMQLVMPAVGGSILKPQRCDERGVPKKDAGYWKIVEDPKCDFLLRFKDS